MTIFRNIMLWAIVAMTVMTTACNVAEFEEDCLVDMQLTFRFTQDGQERFSGAEVPSLSVFVFDEAGVFVGRWDETDNALFGADYTMTLPLAPGTYSFVAWGGLVDTNYYLSSDGAGIDSRLEPVVGVTTLDEFALRMVRQTRNAFVGQANFVEQVPGNLFFGKTNRRTIEIGTDNTVTVDLMKYTKRINLTVVGLPPAATRANQWEHIDITLKASNGSYDFGGTPTDDRQPLTYVQHDATDDGNIIQTSTLYSLRMMFEDDYTLSIYNISTAQEFYSADILRDYIGKVPRYATQQEVDSEDVFDITIDVRSNLGVSVTVNGWDVGISGNVIQ